MNMINMPANEAKCCFKANTKLTEKIGAAFKKYCTENSEILILT